MKFGKSYIDTLARPDFPDEWRKGAIEYKQLKKLINGVVAELEGLGLSQSVLGELLDQQARDKTQRKTASRRRAPAQNHNGKPSAHDTHRTQDSTPHTAQDWLEQVPHNHPRYHRHPVDALLHSESVSDPPRARAESDDAEAEEEADKARSSPPQVLRQLLGSDYATESEVVEVPEASPEAHDDWVHGAGGRRAHAAYELAGEADHPVPRIRITIESPVTSDASDAESDTERAPPTVRLPSPSLGTYPPSVASSGRRRHRDRPSALAEKQAADEADAEADSEPDERQVQGHASPPCSIVGAHRGDVPTSLAETELELAFQDKLAIESGMSTSTKDLTMSPRQYRSSAKARSTHSRSIPPSPDMLCKQPLVRRVRRRQVVVPLLADAQFLDLLTQALVAVQSVQSLQRKEFIAATQRLTQAIGQATSPTGKNQQDLYAWREIFQLWTDGQIFESTREVDAGELPPQESERRLLKFADELHRRGWLQGPFQASRIDTTETLPRAQSISASSPQERQAHPPLQRTHSAGDVNSASRRTGHTQGKIPAFHLPVSHLPASAPDSHHLSGQSEQALQDFMALNVTLLDVKKYQQVNLEAARKILKKHDKRTALSAGTDLKQLLASAQVGKSPVLSGANAGSTEKLPPPPDPVAIANALAANGQTEESHRVRSALKKRWRKPINVAGLNLGGTVKGSSPSASPSASTPTALGLSPPPAPVPAHPTIGALVPSPTAVRPAKTATANKDPEESLGHILFSLMSSQLLPILPSLEEVSCAICTDVAWRPIRLDCSHLFCMRCMVKLQKQGWHDCPLCRAPSAVSSADERTSLLCPSPLPPSRTNLY